MSNGHYELQISGIDLEFKNFICDDPVPTGRQIAELVGNGNPEDFKVLQLLPNGILEDLRLDEKVDLRISGVEKFLVTESDRSFLFSLAEKRMEWPQKTISGLALKVIGGKNPKEFDVFLERQDEPDLLIENKMQVNLSKNGLEKFYFKAKNLIVEFFVNGRLIKLKKGTYSGLDIKQAAIAAGVAIQIDFVLSVETSPGHSLTIGDNDEIKIHNGQQFTALADDDNS